MNEIGDDQLSLKAYFDMLRGNSSFEPQISNLDKSLIMNASNYNMDTHGRINMFVTAATFTEGKRTNNAFRSLNVMIGEIDDIPNTPEHKFVLKPTCLLRTSQKKGADGRELNSYHAYWRLNESITNRTLANDSLQLMKGLLKGVVDEGAMKVAQLLRPPLTTRYKESDRQGNESFSVVEVMYYNPDLSYNIEDFNVWHRLAPRARRIICNKPRQGKRSELDFAAMSRLIEADASTALIKSIFTYSPIGDKYREKGDDYFNLTLSKVQLSAQNSVVQHSIVVKGNDLFYEDGDRSEQLTDFAIEYKATLTPYVEDFPVYHELIINDTTIFLEQEDMQDRRRFTQAIRSINANIFCSQHRMNQIHRYIMSLAKEVDNIVYYSPFAGIVKYKDIYERVPSSTSSLVFNPADKSYLSNIKYTMRRTNPEGLDKVVKAFTTLNDEVTTMTMLGWFTATYFKSFMSSEKLGYSFPFLMVGGAANSGKTTIVTRLFKLFGLEEVNDCALSGKTTNFILTKALSVSETMPVFLKEFRINQGHTGTDISELLRSAYDGGVSRRGTAQQKVNEYKMWRPVVADGQDTFEEVAMVGRTLTVYVNPDKRNKKSLETFDELYQANKGLSYHIINHLLNDMNLNREQLIAQIHSRHKDMVDSLEAMHLDDRSKSNLGLLWFGLTYLYDFVGLKYPDKHLFLACYKDIFNSKTNYMRTDATVLLEYILSQESYAQSTTTTNLDSPDKGRYITFNLARKVRSYSKHATMTGLATTMVLQYRAYKESFRTHGRFLENLGSGKWRLDIQEAKRHGLGE